MSNSIGLVRLPVTLMYRPVIAPPLLIHGHHLAHLTLLTSQIVDIRICLQDDLCKAVNFSPQHGDRHAPIGRWCTLRQCGPLCAQFAPSVDDL